MARMFQDSAGTIPVTTFDQPVGKIVRGAGTVDLVQSVSGSRPTIARWPRGGRRNLIQATKLESWSQSTGMLPAAPFGGGLPAELEAATTAGETATNSQHFFRWEIGTVQVGDLTCSVFVRANGRNRFQFAPERTGASQWAGVTVDLLSGEITNTLTFGGQTVVDSGIVPIGDGWFRVWVKWTPTVGMTGFLVTVLDDTASGSVAAPTYSGSAGAGVALGGWQIEVGSGMTPYQRVTTANDVTEEGVESLCHLYNDGGDSLQTDGPVPAGTYGYAYVDPYGEITFDTRESDGINPVQVADAPGRYLDLILRKGDFSAGEKDQITEYWERLYK